MCSFLWKHLIIKFIMLKMFELCFLFHTFDNLGLLLPCSNFALCYLDPVQNVCHPKKWLRRSTNHTGGNTRCWRGNLFEITLCSFYTSIKTCSAEEEVVRTMRASLTYFRDCFIYIFMGKCFTDARCAVLTLICSFCIYIMTLLFRWGYSFAF